MYYRNKSRFLIMAPKSYIEIRKRIKKEKSHLTSVALAMNQASKLSYFRGFDTKTLNRD